VGAGSRSRPDSHPAWRHVVSAASKGLHAARQNLPAILGIQGLIVIVVVLYYGFPPTRPVFAQISAWQHAGGLPAAMLACACGAGLLAEISAVYFQNAGRWTRPHREGAVFKFILFFISGGIVYEFYRLQAFMFGDSAAAVVVLKKLLVDQFCYTPFWSVPTQSIALRWLALHYSGRELGRELRGGFLLDRMLPALVTNWTFWIPVMTMIYCMPFSLQMPLAIFSTAIWVLLLSALSRHPKAEAAAAPDFILPKIG
jgi:hypothetical protein